MSDATQSLDPRRSFDSKFLLRVALHTLLWGIWILGLFRFGPHYESMYRKINLRLPTMTEFVLSLTHGFIPAALLLVLIFVVIDGAVSYRLRRSLTQTLWSGLMTVAPVAAIVLTCVALCIPALKVLEGLVQ